MGYNYTTQIMFGILVDNLTDEQRNKILSMKFDIGGVRGEFIIVGKYLNKYWCHDRLEYRPSDFAIIYNQLKELGIKGSARVHVYCAFD